MTSNYIFFNINRYLILTIKKMKQIEAKNKKNVLVSSFAKFFRVGILSLFVMLVIPSISSGIFGSSDAHAGCNQRSGASASFQTDANFINALCDSVAKDSGNSISASCNAKEPGTGTIDNENLCTLKGDDGCDTTLDYPIRCTNIQTRAACISNGNAFANCQWTVEDVDNNKLVDAVCRVYQIATGTAGKAFAAVGVISVGIGFFTGKVSWGLMISVAAGIAVFFGAPSIIAVISGDQSATSLCSNVSK